MTEEEQIRAEIEAEMRAKAKRQADDRLRKEAEELIKAADAGDLESQIKVAKNYKEGTRYFPQDLTKAFHYTQMAAEQGHIDSQNRLAHFYADGLGVEKDQTTAFEWFKRSAELGSINSMLMLGDYYMNGCGTEVNIYLATEWLTKAKQEGGVDTKLANAKNILKQQIQQYQEALLVLDQATKHSYGSCLLGRELYIDYRLHSYIVD